LPDLVGKPAVDADGQELCAQSLEILVLGSNCRQLGGSDKGKITWIKAYHYPFTLIVRKLEVFEAAVYKGRGFEVRGGFADFGDHLLLLLGRWLVGT
jgi:hypothetical protein